MARQDELYEEASATFSPALERLARGYEADPDKCRDLLQEIHVALWRSFAGFDGKCSLRTWVYRVAHNRAVSHVRWDRTRNSRIVSLEELEAVFEPRNHEAALDRSRAQERLLSLIHRLPPVDRQIMLLYLEGMDNASIAEIAGTSATNIGTKVHRIKGILARKVLKGDTDVRSTSQQ
jgi:RNA polymerase sigma-70 factor (ECF subfamily)